MFAYVRSYSHGLTGWTGLLMFWVFLILYILCIHVNFLQSLCFIIKYFFECFNQNWFHFF